jgi:hypothetical protein
MLPESVMTRKYTLHGSGTARFGECGLCKLGDQRLSLWLMQCAGRSERASERVLACTWCTSVQMTCTY